MKREIQLFKLACVSFGVSALVWLLTPFGDYKGNAVQVLIAILIGALFWLGLILGSVLLAVVNSHRKRDRKAARRTSGRVGALRFFSNRRAMFADVGMIAFLVLTIALGFIPRIGQTLAIAAFSFFLLSVYMHCVLNGANYQYITLLMEESKK